MLSLGISRVQSGLSGGALGRRAQWIKLSAVSILFDTHSYKFPFWLIGVNSLEALESGLHLSK